MIDEDETFKKDLKDIDALAQKYGGDQLKAFAVVTEIAEGQAKKSCLGERRR